MDICLWVVEVLNENRYSTNAHSTKILAALITLCVNSVEIRTHNCSRSHEARQICHNTRDATDYSCSHLEYQARRGRGEAREIRRGERDRGEAREMRRCEKDQAWRERLGVAREIRRGERDQARRERSGVAREIRHGVRSGVAKEMQRPGVAREQARRERSDESKEIRRGERD